MQLLCGYLIVVLGRQQRRQQTGLEIARWNQEQTEVMKDLKAQR